jgi:hypothetical protein
MDRPSHRVRITVLPFRKAYPIRNLGLHLELHSKQNRDCRGVLGQNSAQYLIFLHSLLTRRFQNASRGNVVGMPGPSPSWPAEYAIAD